MEFAGKVWRLLVGVKDALVLMVLLLFFGLLYAALAGRAPAPAQAGALLVRLNGTLVEEPQAQDPASVLLGNGEAPAQTRARDVERALALAAGDSQVKAVVVDLAGFSGSSGLVTLEEVGAAMDRVRAAGKPVLVYGTMLEDAGLLLAAHGSEVWLDPLGAAWAPGPGGYHLYYGKLLEKLKITAHIFRVGTYKDFVEPYFRNDQSEPSRAAREALYQAIWAEWRANVGHARPKARIDLASADPVGLMKAAGGDAAKAAQSAGLIDRIGTRADFGARVAAIAGADGASKRPGAYAHTGLAAYLARHPESRAGKAIGVVTVAGDIVDGNEGPGTAGGARIARLIDDSAAKNLAALVVRVDSPGGSVTGAEAIRAAILRAKARGLPVVVSMGDMAASGGYWVATPGSRIFARPGTITGSIGIFAVIPSFEKALAAWGVSGDGVRTTPLSGQPDVFTGLTPQMEQLVQAEIEGGYARFVGLVAASRHKSPEAVDAIAQGRVWDGASARGNGLIDAYGGLDEALADAASQAHLGAGAWHADYLGSEKSAFAQWLAQIAPDDGTSDSGDGDAPQDLAGLVADRQQRELAGMLGDVAMLAGSKGAKAYCLECSAALLAPRPLPAGGWPGWLGLAGQVLAAFRR